MQQNRQRGVPTLTSDYHGSDSFDSKCVEDCKEYVYGSSLSSITKDFSLVVEIEKKLATIANASYWTSYLIFSFATDILGTALAEN